MPFLHDVATWLQSAGPVGLFLAAFVDAMVPMAGVVDTLVVVLAYDRRDPLSYTLLATLGSVLGHCAMFALVGTFGEPLVKKILSNERKERLQRGLERYGVAIIAVGGIMPPPFPLKGLVWTAGLARMKPWQFASGLTLARLFRYGLESSLAVFYGDQALEMMKRYYLTAFLAALLVSLAVWLVSRRIFRDRDPPPASTEPTSV